MKKKICLFIGVTFLGAVVTFHANLTVNKSALSALNLANVEALAGCESDIGTATGRECDLTCSTSGGSYTIKACDFDVRYKPEQCTGRCANCD